MAMFPALHASLNVSFFPLTFISYILAIFTSLDALLMLRFSSVFPSLYSTLISSGAWVNLSEMMFLQTQAWSSCFEVFNQGSRVRWAEWEQGNARTPPGDACNLIFSNQAQKTALTLLHLSAAVFCWGREGGRSCWPLPQPAHSRTSLQAQQSSCTDPTHSALT